MAQVGTPKLNCTVVSDREKSFVIIVPNIHCINFQIYFVFSQILALENFHFVLALTLRYFYH